MFHPTDAEKERFVSSSGKVSRSREHSRTISVAKKLIPFLSALRSIGSSTEGNSNEKTCWHK